MQFSFEKGFTLIELLAAIVLMGIIFTALFHFLGQTIFMSSSVEDQYITAQLAEKEVEELKFQEFSSFPISNCSEFNPEQEVILNNTTYLIYSEICNEDLSEVNAGLYRLRVKVEEQESGRSSVAYGWYDTGLGAD